MDKLSLEVAPKLLAYIPTKDVVLGVGCSNKKWREFSLSYLKTCRAQTLMVVCAEPERGGGMWLGVGKQELKVNFGRQRITGFPEAAKLLLSRIAAVEVLFGRWDTFNALAGFNDVLCAMISHLGCKENPLNSINLTLGWDAYCTDARPQDVLDRFRHAFTDTLETLPCFSIDIQATSPKHKRPQSTITSLIGKMTSLRSLEISARSFGLLRSAPSTRAILVKLKELKVYNECNEDAPTCMDTLRAIGKYCPLLTSVLYSCAQANEHHCVDFYQPLFGKCAQSLSELEIGFGASLQRSPAKPQASASEEKDMKPAELDVARFELAELFNRDAIIALLESPHLSSIKTLEIIFDVATTGKFLTAFREYLHHSRPLALTTLALRWVQAYDCMEKDWTEQLQPFFDYISFLPLTKLSLESDQWKEEMITLEAMTKTIKNAEALVELKFAVAIQFWRQVVQLAEAVRRHPALRHVKLRVDVPTVADGELDLKRDYATDRFKDAIRMDKLENNLAPIHCRILRWIDAVVPDSSKPGGIGGKAKKTTPPAELLFPREIVISGLKSRNQSSSSNVRERFWITLCQGK